MGNTKWKVLGFAAIAAAIIVGCIAVFRKE